MASTAGAVLLEVSANLDRLKADVERALAGATDKAARTMEQRLQAAGAKLRGIGNKMSIGITAPLTALGVSSFNAASDLNEALSKVTVVFGDSATDIEAWAETSAKAFGQSKAQALEAAGTYGNLFRAMGMTTQDAASMSTSLVQLAGDLASFNNANPADVLLALRAGLSGETEPLKRFGVNLNAARIEAEALRLGLVKGNADLTKVEAATIAVAKAQQKAAEAGKTYGEDSGQFAEASNKVAQAEASLQAELEGKVPALNAAQKAQAAYSLVMQDTTLAQGDFERTASGAANQQRILAAEFANARAELGQKLLPIGQKIIGMLLRLVQGFSSLPEPLQNVAIISGVVAAAMGPLLSIVGRLIIVLPTLGKAMAAVWASPTMIWVAAIGVIIGLLAYLILNWDQTMETLRGYWNWLRDFGYNLASPFITAVEAIGSAFGAVRDFVQSIIDWLRDAWQTAKDLVSSIPGAGLVGDIAGFISGRAEGGPVQANTPYWVGEKGIPELFVPSTSGVVVPMQDLASSTPSEAVTINVYNPVAEPTSVSVQRVRQQNAYLSGRPA